MAGAALAFALVSSVNGILTGAHVYGLIGLEFCLLLFLVPHKKVFEHTI